MPNIFSKLSTRLLLVVVSVQSVILVVIIWNSVRLINTNLIELFEESIQAETRLLRNSLAPGLAFNDRATIEDVLLLLKKKENLRYISVYNTDGILMAGTEIENHGTVRDTSYQSALTDGVYDVESQISLEGQHLGSVRIGYSVDKVENIVALSRNQNTIIGFIGVAISILLTYLLSIFVTRNLRVLELGTQALRQGDLQHRIDIQSTDEIGDLAYSINQLAEHLDTATEALAKEHKALERETRFMQTLVDGVKAVVMEANVSDLQFTYVSQEAEKLLGYSVKDWLLPGFFQTQIHHQDTKLVIDAINSNISDQINQFTLDYRMSNNMQHTLWVRSIFNVDLNSEGKGKIRGLIMDITEQKTAEDRIVYMAEHDPLTDLINRSRFHQQLDQQITHVMRIQGQGALLFVDLDQFKYINDSYGHQYGDEFLLDVSRRLRNSLNVSDILGRLGGDEFGIIIPEADLKETQLTAENILATINQQTYNFDGKIHHATASVGIVLFPLQGHLANDLLAKADTAMYSAKNNGRGQYHMFSDDDNDLWNMQSKVHWEERIRWALENDRFVLHFQPVARLSDFHITHYEVLLRMLSQENELILPGAFLDTAERFGLIREIDRWVLTNAIKAQAERREAGQQITLAVNISGRHFGSDEIMSLVKTSMGRYGADPGSLMFEVTETAAVENLAQAQNFMLSLKSLGCRFALDDFGVGFSSFHYLRNLPVDYVKIDGSFVRNLHLNKEDRVFVKAMVDMAKGLNIKCIAEFVENAEIISILQSLGVELGQGYYLGRPEPDTLDVHILDLQDIPLKRIANNL